MIINTIFLIQIAVTILFSILAAFYDIKSSIVPNKLNFSLLFFGIVSNLILSVITNNIKYILASFISMLITYVITYMMWKLNIWGGGDVKLFTAIATVIPSGININILNIFPQLSIYPFSFSVVVNSILIAFPFLVVFVTYLVFKNNIFGNNIDFLVNIFNMDSLKYIKDSTLNKFVLIDDLKEGMIVNDYYFNNEDIVELLRNENGNLKIYKSARDDFKFYFKSQSAGGLTNREVWQLKIMNSQNIISDKLSVKIAFPFTPAILFGLLTAIFYGDIMMIFVKNIVLVV
ncbi:MAG: prepilin peptidase [Methanobrevibacter sp.]|uniref:A24 family peptidase n=2 Tax=Methanobacteriaceae TaxID=2159 RepID=UPI0026EF4465|nr:A24 family peptidase [Methanobrevibacter gottschalkii]MBS7258121.1 prepilin peptidase [Methanobrevibacter sp.]MDY3097352.1 A24 family peptidase [Methanobrevibacter sp.]